MDTAFFENLLGEEKIYIADVGSAGGPEQRWSHYRSFCHFYAFDPDPRAVSAAGHSCEIFPIGLWSSQEIKNLQLAKFPQASSLFPFEPGLEVFLNQPCFEILGHSKI
jgi:hypothetical protein